MNVGKEIAVLKHMTVAELRAKYAEVFGEETRSRTRCSWSNASPGGSRRMPRVTCPSKPGGGRWNRRPTRTCA